jgi:D-proline reductase (dithiol) PrdB
MGLGEKMFDLRQQKDKATAKLFSKSPWLFKQWVRQSTFLKYDDSPWSALTKPIDECRLALITTGGVHLKSQVPFDMADPAGDPSFREIPANTARSDLTITHNYYDHRDAEKDINIVFPIERVRTLAAAGDIGAVNHRHFSFMGHIIGPHLETLITETAPRVARMLKMDAVDIVILTPA